MNVMITRHTRTINESSELYSISDLMIVVELAKLVLAMVLEVIHTHGQISQSIWNHNIRTAEGLKVSIPAFLYYIQNTLFYVALSTLSSPVFMVTSQMKLMMTAFASVLFLHRRYTLKQWMCLFFLSCGVAAAAPEKSQSTSMPETYSLRLTGLLAVLGASVCSSLAGVSFEKFLQSRNCNLPLSSESSTATDPSVYMRNIQLAFFSILFAGLHKVTSKRNTMEQSNPFLYGFSYWVWLLVGLRATTGLVVAFIIKQTSSVVKGIASGVSLIVGCVISVLFFGNPLTVKFCIGAGLVMLSTYIFSNDTTNLFECFFSSSRQRWCTWVFTLGSGLMVIVFFHDGRNLILNYTRAKI